jgi:hypothetical protein
VTLYLSVVCRLGAQLRAGAFTTKLLWACLPFSRVLSASNKPDAIKAEVLSFLIPVLNPTWLAAAVDGGSGVQVLVRGKGGGRPVQWSEGVQLLWQPTAACVAELQQLGLWDIHQPHRLRNQPTWVLRELLVARLHAVLTQDALWHTVTPVMTGCGGLPLEWHEQHSTTAMLPSTGTSFFQWRRHHPGK